MFPPDLEALARSIVPGEGAVSLRRLGTGLLNATYRAVRDGATYALRVPVERGHAAADRAWEILVLEQASRAGLAPPLVYVERSSGVLLLAWVRGDSWSESCARSSEALDAMAQLLRAVHALPIPTPARRMDAGTWIECYTRALAPRTCPAAAELSEAAARAIRSLQELQPAGLVVCHSDLHRLNVLQRETPGEDPPLLLLDWEYAHVSDAFWDLAGWSANNDLPEEAQRALLHSYGGVPITATQWARFRLQFWLYDYICLLWIELYVRLRPAESAAIAPRAGWLERRLRSQLYGTIISY